jgi:polyphosphate kinase 2 (PPK2 family)
MAEPETQRLTELAGRLRVAPGANVELARDFDPAFRDGWRKREAAETVQRNVELLAAYQDRLATEAGRGLLVVLQGIDASGKDGTCATTFCGATPARCPAAARSLRRPLGALWATDIATDRL